MPVLSLDHCSSPSSAFQKIYENDWINLWIFHLHLRTFHSQLYWSTYQIYRWSSIIARPLQKEFYLWNNWLFYLLLMDTSFKNRTSIFNSTLSTVVHLNFYFHFYFIHKEMWCTNCCSIRGWKVHQHLPALIKENG